MDIKRPRFQYHLSTLVIITILAGILLGAHVRPEWSYRRWLAWHR